jgi:hypothetical protein
MAGQGGSPSNHGATVSVAEFQEMRTQMGELMQQLQAHMPFLQVLQPDGAPHNNVQLENDDQAALEAEAGRIASAVGGGRRRINRTNFIGCAEREFQVAGLQEMLTIYNLMLVVSKLILMTMLITVMVVTVVIVRDIMEILIANKMMTVWEKSKCLPPFTGKEDADAYFEWERDQGGTNL